MTDLIKPERNYFKWEPPKFRHNDPNDVRYDCLECEDSGWILVWHSKSEWYMRDDPEAFNWKQHMAHAAARCGCRHGQEKSRSIPTYKPLLMAKFDPLVSQEENIAALKELIERTPVAVEFNPDSWEPT